MVGAQEGHVPQKLESSAKMQLLQVIARATLRLGEKLVVFSQSIPTLNMIERLIRDGQLLGESSTSTSASARGGDGGGGECIAIR